MSTASHLAVSARKPWLSPFVPCENGIRASDALELYQHGFEDLARIGEYL